MADVLPIDIWTQHSAIVGKVGSGKTYAAKGIVETLLDAQRRCLIIDPTDAWWGLRTSADGKRPAYPVIVLGGENADVPITRESGDAIAKLVSESSGSFIVSTSDFSQGEKHHLMTDLAEGLLQLNRKPLHLIIDEADDVAPQNPLPESRRMLGAFDRIVRRGRKLGFRVMMISQRPAVLHKNVLSQASTLIAMKLVSPQDRKAIEEWVKGQADADQGKKVLASLSKMQRGEGWVWCPEEDVLKRMVFPKIDTFDSSASPDEGDAVVTAGKMASVDLEFVRKMLAPPPEPEKPQSLDITTSDIDWPKIDTEAATAEGYKRGHADGYAEGQRVGRDAALREIFGKFSVIADQITDFRAWLDTEAVAAFVPYNAPVLAPPVDHIGDRADGRPDNRFYRQPAAPKANGVDKRWQAALGGERRMFDALIAKYPHGLGRDALAHALDMTASGGTFNTYLSRLRSNNLIEEDGKMVKAHKTLFMR